MYENPPNPIFISKFQGFISPNGVSQPIEIKSEPQPFSPTNSTTSQSSLTSQTSFENFGHGGGGSSNPHPFSNHLTPQHSAMSPDGTSLQSPPHQFQHNPGGGGPEERKGKKGPTPRPSEELCLVCGDRASGQSCNEDSSKTFLGRAADTGSMILELLSG